MYTRLANYIKETRGNGWGIEHLGGNGGEKVISTRHDTTLFPQDMIQDIYKLHWNIIHK